MLDALNADPTSFARQINDIALIFVITGGINIFSGMMQVSCWTLAGERMSQKFRENYVTSILKQEIGWFDTVGVNELSTKVADLSGKVQDGTTRKVGDLTQYLSQFIASFAVGLYLCWPLTVVLLAAFPLIGGAGAFMIGAITEAVNNAGENYAAAGGVASETLGNIRTVTSLNAQPSIISRYRLYLLDAMQVGIRKGRDVGIGNGAVFSAAFLTYSLGFWYGGKLVADDLDRNCDINVESCLTGGTVLAVFFCVIMGSIALGQVVPPLSSFLAAKVAITPMLEIINREPEIDGLSDKGITPEGSGTGNLELKNVNFAYPSRPDIQVCKDYNLSIVAGETIALVGASGSGKSTIVNLLLRFYDVQDGLVTFDGNNIKDLNIKWLRSQIGYVGQEPVLFSGSVADNIASGLDGSLEKGMAAKDPTIMEKITSAAKLANCYDFVSEFPDGFNTDVGTGGIAMSGGQKQRIAIARALVKKPSVLLLDEATSALDATSERLVQESIDALQKSKAQTTLVIAHRLSTIRNADKIAVVDAARIVELGSHDDLVKKNGRYADLIRLQTIDEPDEVEKIDDLKAADAKTAVIRKTATGPVTEDSAENKVVISEEEQKKIWAKVNALILMHPLWLTAALFGACVFGSMFPCWGLLLAKTQNMFYYTDTTRMRRVAAEMALWYILLATCALFSSTLQYWGCAQVSERMSMKLRSGYFEAMVRREVSYFDEEENATGSLTTRLAEDSRAVATATGETVPRQLQATFTLIIGIGLAMNASWKLALVVIATFPVSIAASAVQMMAFAGQQYDKDDKKENPGSIISSAFTHMRTVTAFSMQYKVSADFNALTRKQSLERCAKSWVGGLGFGAAQASMFCTYALLFWYGSKLIEAGEIEFENMMIAIMSLMLGAIGLGQALADLGNQTQGLEAAKRIFDAIDGGSSSPIDGLSDEGIIPTGRAKGKITLKDVSFRYPTRPDVEVCKGYSLNINPGEVVALVGPSGGGKSTIMNLLLRFYDPEEGSVMVDDQSIQDLNVRWLRSQIGYVGQEPALFSGSVASNIAKGLPSQGNKPLLSLEEAMQISDGTTDEEGGDTKAALNIEPSAEEMKLVIEACKASNAHDFISSFPEGYQTDVGEGSLMVSGGQKQRIAIARALIKKPSILLLDEATSALDATSERLVQESIDALQKSKAQTTLVIAHRLTTIRNADKIAVIDKGRVVQVGTHDDLLADDKGLYATLWAKQSGKKH